MLKLAHSKWLSLIWLRSSTMPDHLFVPISTNLIYLVNHLFTFFNHVFVNHEFNLYLHNKKNITGSLVS